MVPLFVAVVLALVCHGSSVESQDVEEISFDDLENLIQQGVDMDCKCEEACECCGMIAIDAINLNRKGCISIRSIKEKRSLEFVFKLNDRIIMNKTISTKNPPRVCGGIPWAGLFADMCFHFYDIEVQRDRIHVCLKIIPRFLRNDITEYKIRCMDLKVKSDGDDIFTLPTGDITLPTLPTILPDE